MHGAQFLISPQVEVFPELPLSTLEIAIQIGEVALLVASIRFADRHAIPLQMRLQFLGLFRHFLQFLLASSEFLLEFFLCLHGRGRFPKNPLGINEADLRFGGGCPCRNRQ